ncbi:MAG: hypothetical protein M9936_02780 [Caldilinea sp.]|nr:hypothetical protein [Caldilinea sp.]MCB0147392.1 hypothetical protein [Caldilineaceae bacterium]MCB9140684.1 hypothetical protein [Anaerolineales bacterium]MCO5208593.1 hypothetical protein [Caldilinea sp.]
MNRVMCTLHRVPNGAMILALSSALSVAACNTTPYETPLPVDPTRDAANEVLAHALATDTPAPESVEIATAVAATLTAQPTATSTSTPTRTPTPKPTHTPTPLPLTYPTIAYGVDTLKGEGWKRLEESVIGATVVWTGTVSFMPMFSGDISVDVGQDHGWRDVTLIFGDDKQREQLKTGDFIRFRATVEKLIVVWWNRRFEVRLSTIELLEVRHQDSEK